MTAAAEEVNPSWLTLTDVSYLLRPSITFASRGAAEAVAARQVQARTPANSPLIIFFIHTSMSHGIKVFPNFLAPA